MSQVSLVPGRLGEVPGVTTEPTSENATTQITTGDLQSMYLPTPYAPRAFSAEGEWRHDPASLMIVATGADRSQAADHLEYSVSSWTQTIDGAAFSQAQAGQPNDSQTTTELPEGIPESIIQLTNEITTGAEGPVLQAAAIQAWLRSENFTYSTANSSGNTSFQATARFLTETHTGYALDFASAMALMARIVQIPSRIAVGYLPGEDSGDGWDVTAHDMHAWPELYFRDFGWIRFEPTPVVAFPPPWTVLAPEQPPEATQTTSVTMTVNPEAEPSVEASEMPATEMGSTPPTWKITTLATIIALLVASILLPHLIRRRIRSRRLAAGRKTSVRIIEDAWVELRGVWQDLGHYWPTGSPRKIGRIVEAQLTDSNAVQRLDDLVGLVGEARYAPQFMISGLDFHDSLALLEKSLKRDVPRFRRVLAWWLPSSLWLDINHWIERKRLQRRKDDVSGL
jgi:transglutaminase-like putative cysteine protease